MEEALPELGCQGMLIRQTGFKGWGADSRLRQQRRQQGRRESIGGTLGASLSLIP